MFTVVAISVFLVREYLHGSSQNQYADGRRDSTLLGSAYLYHSCQKQHTDGLPDLRV
jgi:hypothetical protein